MLLINESRADLIAAMSLAGSLDKVTQSAFELDAKSHQIELRRPNDSSRTRPALIEAVTNFAVDNDLHYQLRYDTSERRLKIGTGSRDDLDLFIVLFG